MTIQDKIREQVTSNRVVLYMKGTPQSPQCGFSATTVEILKRCGVTDYQAVDVLQDPEIRQGIKEYANWPTIPQLYVDRELIGGVVRPSSIRIDPNNAGQQCALWGSWFRQ